MPDVGRTRRRARSRALSLVILAAGSLLGCNASTGDETHVELSPSAPGSVSEGGTSVQEFWGQVVELPYYDTVKPAPPINDVGALLARADAVVEGTVRAVEVVDDEWKPADDYPSTAGRVRLLVHVEVARVLLDRDQGVNDEFVWEVPAWTGDPAHLAEERESIASRFKSAPIGARVLLFGEAASGAGLTWWVVSGVMQDQTSTVKVDLGRKPTAVSDEFSNVDSLSAHVESVGAAK